MARQLTNFALAGSPARDVGGFPIFATGEFGPAHVAAHRLFDQGRLQEGHRRLGSWLATHSGAGSDWVHLQFHMALFEIAVGKWYAAYLRFTNEILPVAAATGSALTDAPSLAWRLQLTAPRPVVIAWDVLRRTALRYADHPATPFVELHHLLALAGADDLENIERWLQKSCSRGARSLTTTVLTSVAVALGAWCRRDYRAAAVAIRRSAPRLHLVGGSHAQRQLFIDLERAARQRADARTPIHTYLAAA